MGIIRKEQGKITPGSFKIRASAASQIMGQRGLGKTGENFVKTWLKEQLYGRTKEIKSKYLDKGNICEDNSLDYIAEQLGYGVLVKNEESFENDYFKGTPDIVLNDHLIDVKNSWDPFTFPLFEKEINQAYYAQGQVYMSLTGRKSYKLIYVLSDTPDHLIQKEAYFYCKDNGYDELDPDIEREYFEKMTYKDIPDNLKIKVFEFDYDTEYLGKLQERVLMCRDLIKLWL